MTKLNISAKSSLMISIFLLLIYFPIHAYSVDILWAYARWKSLYSGYYDALQTGKEISWDEQYDAEIGIRELTWEDATFSIALNSRQFFDENVVYLKNISLGVQKEDWNFSAESLEYGYGKDVMNSDPILHKGFATYTYQPMRLNALQISHQDIAMKVGGNKHNQATAIVRWAKDSEGFLKALRISQEVRAMDNHWRTPVAISALNFKVSTEESYLNVRYPNWPEQQNWWYLSGTLAASYLPVYDSTDEKLEFFGYAKFHAFFSPTCDLKLEAVYTAKDYAPKTLQQYRLQVDKSYSWVKISPLTEYSIIDDESYWSHRLNLVFPVKNDYNVGLYYENSYFQPQNPRHTFGLALDFRLEFPLITTELQNP